MTGHTVALIGAGGVTGEPVIRAFRKRGIHVRVLTRSSGARAFPHDVETRSADLLDVDSLISALTGADSIHYIPPSFDPREEEYARNLIGAAQQSDVPRVIYHSVLHASTPDMPHHHRKALVELLLRQSALDWTILQPAMYAQTALAFLDAEARELTPAFDTKQPFAPLHDEDLADAVAIVHSTDGHRFATYELAGPELLDFAAMAERIGTVLGRRITARRVPAEELASRVAAARRYTDDQVRELMLMFDHYNRYGLVGNGNVLRMILGREPADFLTAARRSLSTGAADA